MPNKIFTEGENLWAQKSNVASGISNIPDQCCFCPFLGDCCSLFSEALKNQIPFETPFSPDWGSGQKSNPWQKLTGGHFQSCQLIKASRKSPRIEDYTSRYKYVYVSWRDLDFSLYELLSLKWSTIANYCHWHGQLSWRARLQIRGAVRFFPASSILSSHRPNISSHSVLVLAQY